VIEDTSSEENDKTFDESVFFDSFAAACRVLIVYIEFG
jgi:hypothetical protein